MTLTRASLVVLLLLTGCGGDDAPEANGYRISYTVVTPTATTTEVVEVARGEVSLRVVGELATVTTRSGVFQRRGGDWQQLAVVPPGEVGEDLQLTAALDWASQAGIAAPVGTSRVGGTECRQWRTAEPLELGTWAAATSASSTVSCVDAEGRLLSDVWTLQGRTARTRTATAVSTVEVTPFDGASPPPIAPSLVTAAVTRLAEPAADLVTPGPPAGGTLLAAVQVLQVTPGTLDVTGRTQRAVYRVGAALVVLDQVRGAGTRPQGSRPLDLGGLGAGRVRATGGGLVLEVAVGQGLVRVRSGLPYDATVAWLSGLRRV